ncbi:MAG: phenylacetate--CoA ligase family protein [Aureliella sp.]
MSAVQEVYNRCPIPVQSALINAWGAAWYLRRHGKHYREKVQQLCKHEWLTADEFAQLQLTALNRLLEHARRSRHYRQTLGQSGVDGPLGSLAELSRLPLLSKQVLRADATSLLTGRPPWGTKVLCSSGTSGTPTRIYYTKQFQQQGLAYFQARVRNWAGVAAGERRAMFGARKLCAFQQTSPPFWRHSVAENLVYFSVYHLSPQNLPAYIDYLQSWAPRLIMGFPSALNTIACAMLERGSSLTAKAVITTSETVSLSARENIERAFNCRLFDQYGCVENTHFVSQCEHGRYHVSPERGIIEILDGDTPCAPGQPGRIVATGLENWLQPLIRYEVGDAAYWAVDQNCPCGRQMPVIGGIEGRHEDFVTLPDGRTFMRLDPIFKAVEGVIEGQVVQEAANHFSVNVVTNAAFTEREKHKLVSNFRLIAGDARIDIHPVESIPRTASGKFRAVINRMNKAS